MIETTLPEWIEPEAWEGWIQMRKLIKKPATDRAQMLAIRKLWRLKALGHDPNSILDQSTMNCWQDLWPPKEQGEAQKMTASELAEKRWLK